MQLFIFLCLGRARVVENIHDVVARANEYISLGDFQRAESEYASCSDEIFSDKYLQREYLIFLLKSGQYDKILHIEKKLFNGMQHYVETAKTCRGTLATKDPKRIAELVDTSPYSIEVLKMAVRDCLSRQDFVKYRKYIHILSSMKAPRVDKKFLDEMQGLFEAYRGNYHSAIKSFRAAGAFETASELEKVTSEFSAIKEQPISDKERIALLKSLYRRIAMNSAMDIYKPSIYSRLTVLVLREVLELALSSRVSGYSGDAQNLYNIDKGVDSLFIIIQVLVQDEKLDEAKAILERHKNEIDSHRRSLLSSIIEETAKKIQKKKEEAEAAANQERQKQREQEKSRYYHQRREHYTPPPQAATSQKENHYKVLGVDKNAPLNKIKSAYRKKKRELDRNYKDNENDPKKRDEEMLLNRACDVLSDEKTRAEYDASLEAGTYGSDTPYYQQPSGGRGGYYQQQGYGDENLYGFMDDNIGSIFENFFSTGRGGGKQRRFYTYRYL